MESKLSIKECIFFLIPLFNCATPGDFVKYFPLLNARLREGKKKKLLHPTMSGARGEINQVPECPPHLPFIPWWWKTQGKHFGVPSPLIKRRVSQRAVSWSATTAATAVINTRFAASRAKRRYLASQRCLLQLLGRYWAQLASEKVFSHAVMNGRRRHIIYFATLSALPLSTSQPPSD